MRFRLLSSLTPGHYIYLLIHVVIVLIGLIITSNEDPNWKAIGTSITATGITGWVIFFYVRLADGHTLDRERLRKLGVVTAFAARSVPIRPEYERRFNAARQQIDFCGFGLRALREDFLPDFRKWLKHSKVRILLIDPEAPNAQWKYTEQRDYEEGNSLGSIERDVFQFLQATLPIKLENPDSFDVRLYRCIPAINICRIDDEIFWGPYLIGEQSRNTLTFLVEASGALFRELSDHYERIWKDDSFSRAAFVAQGDGQLGTAIGAVSVK